MTPEEKAKELVERFHYCLVVPGIEANVRNARYCALIAVDEIIKVIPMYTGNLNPDWSYWQSVKQQIEKL